MRKGVHRPGDSHADDQEKNEGPEDISDALVGAAAAEEPEGDRDYERENHHGLKMAEPEFVYEHHIFSRVGIMFFRAGASCFAGSRDFVGVKCGEHVKDSGGGEQAGAVVAVGVRDVWSAGLEGLGHKIKTAGTQVGDVAEFGESVFAVTRKNIAAHSGTENDQEGHGGKADQGSTPHF